MKVRKQKNKQILLSDYAFYLLGLVNTQLDCELLVI